MNVREFRYLFFRDWENEGGLIQPSVAAKILGVTRGRISQLCETGSITKYIYDEPTTPLVSLKDVQRIKIEKILKLSPEAQAKIKEKELQWEEEFKLKLLKEMIYSTETPIIKKAAITNREEIIESELEEYEEYMEKEIGKK